ncbi:MAG: ATP-dependent DNA helicase RecG [Acidobacteria bacterium]|nr:ATP-dependent DNA helicase RecG [Acidobacteriota bacterium]
MTTAPALDSPVTVIPGVAEKRASLLNAAGVRTLGDLVRHLPSRYEDRRLRSDVADLASFIGTPVKLTGKIVSAHAKRSPVRRLGIFEAVLDDGTGRVSVVWFNQAWLKEKIARDMIITIWGQPRVNSKKRLQIENPDWSLASAEDAAEDSVIPVYPVLAGMTPAATRKLVHGAFEVLGAPEDPLTRELAEALGVGSLAETLVPVHFPAEIDEALTQCVRNARTRLAVEEFFAFQLMLAVSRMEEEAGRSRPPLEVGEELKGRIGRMLPFRLTGAQKRAVREIVADLESDRPMYRLLQGDVASGKTIVGLIAAVIVIRNRRQVAFMVPTEILAEQHFERIRGMLDAEGVRTDILTASVKGEQRRAVLRRIASAETDLVVGTHALIQEGVEFGNLGLAIVDEMHRFGVKQRRDLIRKGVVPDVLVMSATPIPRSMAIAAFADLDLSVIDELPPGRPGIRTVTRGSAQFEKIYRFVREEIESGAQAYFVFPLIDESEESAHAAIRKEIENLRRRFPGVRMEPLHGQMSSEEKDAVMRRFARGETKILVATTIVEVGIDVADATVMVIHDADRFGLSQLHQLRGRVGRGSRQSWCVAVRDERASEEGKRRLRLFASTPDGFELARIDLEQRGFGHLFGVRQSGANLFRYGDPLAQPELMERARAVARKALETEGLAKAKMLCEVLRQQVTTIHGKD